MGIIQDETVLVTGSDGFVGRHVVTALRNSGYTVYEFDRRDGDIAMAELSYDRLDHIIHLASMVYVPLSWENPYPFYRTNVLGTINVLELCRKTGCRLTYISSYIYGTPQYLPVDENHPIDPASPYNHSKFMAEEACRFYAGTFNVPVVIFRPVNIYGPGQNPDFLIPFIINQITDPATKQVEVKDLRPRRDYLFIDDFTDALLRSFTLDGFHIFNLGSGKSVSVEDIIGTVMRQSGISKDYHSTGQERTHEIWDVIADIRKLSKETGWKPMVSFEEGIRKILASGSPKPFKPPV